MFFLDRSHKKHRLLLLLLFVNFFTEVLNWVLLLKNYPIQPTVNGWIFFHTLLWFFLFFVIHPYKKTDAIIITSFVVYAIINISEFEGMFKLNYTTFLLGALSYITIFLVDSFKRLKNEELSYFYSNDFLLVSSPILFFMGTSLMFGFRERAITRVLIIGETTLYQTIIYFVNFVYYTIINIYIFKNIGLKNK